jgi:hypothetical protein
MIMSTFKLTTEMLRTMAWERAKGELRSMIPTHIALTDNPKHSKLAIELKKFIANIEDNGLHG